MPHMAERVFKASVTLLTFEQEAVATSALRLSPRGERFLSLFVEKRLEPPRIATPEAADEVPPPWSPKRRNLLFAAEIPFDTPRNFLLQFPSHRPSRASCPVRLPRGNRDV